MNENCTVCTDVRMTWSHTGCGECHVYDLKTCAYLWFIESSFEYTISESFGDP